MISDISPTAVLYLTLFRLENHKIPTQGFVSNQRSREGKTIFKCYFIVDLMFPKPSTGTQVRVIQRRSKGKPDASLIKEKFKSSWIENQVHKKGIPVQRA
jgi:hypothetical protein